jgi:hypothetical protein
MTKVIAPWETRLHVHQSWGLPMQEENIMHGMHHCFTFKLGQECEHIATT